MLENYPIARTIKRIVGKKKNKKSRLTNDISVENDNTKHIERDGARKITIFDVETVNCYEKENGEYYCYVEKRDGETIKVQNVTQIIYSGFVHFFRDTTKNNRNKYDFYMTKNEEEKEVVCEVERIKIGKSIICYDKETYEELNERIF